MVASGCIEQKGVVEEITDEFVIVNISSFSACANCESNSACSITDSTSKLIHVPGNNADLTPGDHVWVEMKRSLGLRATLIAYIVPFLIVTLSILLLSETKMGELMSGLLSLIILVPYFFVIYMYRNQLQRIFTFKLKKAV